MKPAGFFKRLFSLIYDTLAVLGIILSSSLILVWINGGATPDGSFAFYIQRIILILSGPIFYSYFWIKNEGQTLGMQAWKIRLQTEGNQTMDLKVSLMRCLVSCISFAFIGLGYFWIFFDSSKRSWADMYTKTKIIDIKK